jgi:hypothetical protein
VMIHGCQRLKADLNRDFRFGLLSRASYASPAFDDNELIVCKRRMGVYSEHWWLKIKNPHYAQTGDATRCLRRLGNIARTTNLSSGLNKYLLSIIRCYWGAIQFAE